MRPSQKYEHDAADDLKKLGGRRIPYSGAGMEDGDVSTYNYLIDCKTMETIANQKSYRVTLETWEKAVHEADLSGKIPALKIGILKHDLIVEDYEDWKAHQETILDMTNELAASKKKIDELSAKNKDLVQQLKSLRGKK